MILSWFIYTTDYKKKHFKGTVDTENVLNISPQRKDRSEMKTPQFR